MSRATRTRPDGLKYDRAYYLKNRNDILARQRQRHQDKRDQILRQMRDQQLRRKYGITLEQFEAMARKQRHRCAVCRRLRKLVVDHCHRTKKVRGLLCDQCNRAAGLLSDKPSYAQKMAEYLRCA